MAITTIELTESRPAVVRISGVRFNCSNGPSFCAAVRSYKNNGAAANMAKTGNHAALFEFCACPVPELKVTDLIDSAIASTASARWRIARDRPAEFNPLIRFRERSTAAFPRKFSTTQTTGHRQSPVTQPGPNRNNDRACVTARAGIAFTNRQKTRKEANLRTRTFSSMATSAAVARMALSEKTSRMAAAGGTSTVRSIDPGTNLPAKKIGRE